MAGSNPVGRPTMMTEAMVNKLEQAFSMGASDKEACFYAGISHQTLYNYQEKNPKFVERKELLKERPILEARQSVINHMKNDGNLALKFLERRKKDEFGLHSDITVELRDPITLMIKKFGLDNIEGGEDDRENDGDVPVSSPENA